MSAEEIVEQVAQSTGLPITVAGRVVEDVLAFYRQSAEQFIRTRHGQLQAQGKKNPEIFSMVAAELEKRLVAPPALSERQLRRIIYG